MATYYIATDGDDSNSGLSLAAPWLHIEKINAVNLLPGDIVNIRAGTYDSYSPLFATAFYNIRINAKNGTAGSHITIQGYPPDFTGGGRVVYNCLNVARTSGGIGICTLDCSYIDFFRISVVGPAQEVAGGSGTYAAAWWFSANTSKTNVTATNCEASFSMTGFRLDNVNNATYTNCDAHDIDDPFTGPPTGAHNNSDGFSRTNALNTATGTVYNGCRAWYCADDGWDCFGTSGTITYNNCWSFKNGYNSSMVHLGDGNGFKMGSAASTGNRFAYNNLAYGNYVHGFDQNAGNFVAVFYNNSAINNGGNDWKFGYNPPLAHVFRNNLSYGNAAIDGTSGDAADWGTNDFNSWNGGVTLTTDDFVSLDDTQLDDTRQADGSLPVITAFHLASDSDLIDAGVDVGIAFNGAAPDMGAFEFGDPLPEGTITELTIAFTECDDGTTGGYQISYRVSGDEEWIDGGVFFSSPAVITGLSYPSGTVFDVQGVNTDCDEESGSGGSSVVIADNGLSNVDDMHVVLGGDVGTPSVLESNRYIDTDVYSLNLDSSTAAGGSVILKIDATDAAAGAVINTVNDAAIVATSVNSIGEVVTSTNSVALISTSNNAIAGIFKIIPAATGGIISVIQLQRQTTGTAIDGIGGAISLVDQTDDDNLNQSNRIIWKWTDAAAATRTSQMILAGVLAATDVDMMTFNANGSIQFRPIPAVEASALTPALGMMVCVNTTDATFTSLGFWNYDGTSWNHF